MNARSGIGKVYTWYRVENLGFFHLKCGKNGLWTVPSMLRRIAGRIDYFCHALAAWCMPRAHGCCLRLQIACFFVFLGICFHIICIGTWEHNSSLYNVFWGLLNLHSWFSKSLQMFCFVDLYDFFLNYIKTPYNCYVSGKTEITWFNIKNITNVSKTIDNCSNTPQFWIKTN